MRGIVVGYDASPGGERALRWALREGALRGGPVRVVQAWWHVPWADAAGILWPLPTEVIRDVERERREAVVRLEREVRAMQHDERADGIDVHTELSEAAPAQALLEAASGAELLVVGSRGHGGFVGLLLGSVGQQCVHHAPCPVVIVPDERDGETDRSAPAVEHATAH